MIRYVVGRLGEAVVVTFIVTVLAFLFMRIVPGDPAAAIAGRQATARQIELIRQELWLDRSLPVQYGHWIDGLLHGDLGLSVRRHEDVASIIAHRAPISIFLAAGGILLGSIVGITVGMICAIRRGGFLDAILSVLVNLGLALPIFWVGIMLIYLVGLELGWLPICGWTSPLEDFWLGIRKAIMPIVCLSVFPMAFLARQTRSSMLEVIHEDYIRTAWAKGLTERVIILRHAMKNAFIPIITSMGLLVARIAGGAVMVEVVFNIPGMGRLLVDSVWDQDYLIVQGCIVVIGVLVLFVNLVVDLSYGFVNPRVRY